MGAGLGGGSADAAAALKAGWMLWKNPHSKEIPVFKKIPTELLAIAKRLGADVSFFLMGGTAWAEGIGEKLKQEKPGLQRWLVLVYPRVHVSTKEAYGLLDASRKNLRASLARSRALKEREGERVNSFEPVILKKFRPIKQAKMELERLGCREVMMSGSGSTVYGFVESAAAGANVLNQLADKPWDTFLAHTR
jgi:4-diphosphocytidyl-2-C-methyl-D-erythritol kinase